MLTEDKKSVFRMKSSDIRLHKQPETTNTTLHAHTADTCTNMKCMLAEHFEHSQNHLLLHNTDRSSWCSSDCSQCCSKSGRQIRARCNKNIPDFDFGAKEQKKGHGCQLVGSDSTVQCSVPFFIFHVQICTWHHHFMVLRLSARQTGLHMQIWMAACCCVTPMPSSD